MLTILQNLVKDGNLYVSSLVNNKPLKDWLIQTTSQYQPTKLTEMAYIALYGPPPLCEFGNKRQFDTFIKGYRKGCIFGNKCRCVDKYRMEGQKETLKRKYGVTAVSHIPGITEKRKATSMERYGVDHITKTPQYKKKSRELWAHRTQKEKSLIAEKREQTFLQKYGETHHMKLEKQKQKVSNAHISKLMYSQDH